MSIYRYWELLLGTVKSVDDNLLLGANDSLLDREALVSTDGTEVSVKDCLIEGNTIRNEN